MDKDKSAKENAKGARSQIEEALQSTAANVEELNRVARSHLEEAVHTGRAKLGEARSFINDASRDAAENAGYYVQEHPWRSVGIAAGIGLVLGLLLNRK